VGEKGHEARQWNTNHLFFSLVRTRRSERAESGFGRARLCDAQGSLEKWRRRRSLKEGHRIMARTSQRVPRAPAATSQLRMSAKKRRLGGCRMPARRRAQANRLRKKNERATSRRR